MGAISTSDSVSRASYTLCSPGVALLIVLVQASLCYGQQPRQAPPGRRSPECRWLWGSSHRVYLFGLERGRGVVLGPFVYQLLVAAHELDAVPLGSAAAAGT